MQTSNYWWNYIKGQCCRGNLCQKVFLFLPKIFRIRRFALNFSLNKQSSIGESFVILLLFRSNRYKNEWVCREKSAYFTKSFSVFPWALWCIQEIGVKEQKNRFFLFVIPTCNTNEAYLILRFKFAGSIYCISKWNYSQMQQTMVQVVCVIR